jgi:pilus assembly protein CpaF
MSRVVGWKVVPKSGKAAGEVGVTPAFEFSPAEEALFAKVSSEYAGMVEGSPKPVGASPQLFGSICERILSLYSVPLPKARVELVSQAAFHTFGGYGCVDFLLSKKDYEEVSFVGTEKPLYVFSRRDCAWHPTNCYICSERFATSVANRMAQKSGKRLSFATPRLDAQLSDGERLHAACPPISPSGVSFSIRLFPQSKMTVPDLVNAKMLSAKAAAFLWFAMQSDCSAVVCGNTGGGKTTLLNAMCDLIGMRERLILVEDTPELSPSQSHVARLVAARAPMSDLIKDTLRMRPDRVIVGEVRNAEDSRALFDCLLSGQARGTYSTFHSDSAQECLDRMRLLGATEHDLGALDLIACARRIPVYDISRKAGTEVRRVTEICEVFPKGGVATPRQIFSYSAGNGRLDFLGLKKSGLSAKIRACLSNVRERDFGAEWKRRERFLCSKAHGGPFAEEVEKYLYGNHGKPGNDSETGK